MPLEKKKRAIIERRNKVQVMEHRGVTEMILLDVCSYDKDSVECGFSRAVRSQKAQECPLRDGKGEMLKNRSVVTVPESVMFKAR